MSTALRPGGKVSPFRTLCPKILTTALILIEACITLLFSDTPSRTFQNPKAKDHYEKALLQGERSNWNAAVLELNRALQYEPRNPTLLLELGIALGELQHWDAAIKILKRAIALSPNSARAHYNLAVTLDRANPGKGEGIDVYRRALRLNPKDVSSLINLAVDLGDRDIQEAKRLFERAISLDPKNAGAYFNLGLLLRNSGDSKGALLALQKAIGLNPDSVEPRRQLVTLLISQERWDEILEQCREILKREPNDWNIRYSFGQTLVRLGNSQEGKKELQKSQEIRQSQQKREDLERLLGRGLSNLTKGAVEDAIKNFRSLLEVDPGSAQGHMYLGVALATIRDTERGIAELNKAIELDPTNARAHHNLGTVLLQAGRVDVAYGEFEKALGLDPYFPETHNNLGLILSKNKQMEKAVDHFRTASELNPQYVEALFNLGLALRSMNRIADAAQAFRRAADAAPNNAQVQFALGIALKDQGNLKEAEQALSRANALQQSEAAKPNR
ncbi:MAG: tetratricopeptide repeat protein [Acidimicrobiia bacterium]|nr:tetratricopeptide repeat protein [Acidimicrobiia bacterium]